MPACASSGVYVPRDTHRCDAAVLVRHHVARFLERVAIDHARILGAWVISRDVA